MPCAAAYNRVAQFDHFLNSADPRTVITGNFPESIFAQVFDYFFALSVNFSHRGDVQASVQSIKILSTLMLLLANSAKSTIFW